MATFDDGDGKWRLSIAGTVPNESRIARFMS